MWYRESKKENFEKDFRYDKKSYEQSFFRSIKSGNFGSLMVVAKFLMQIQRNDLFGRSDCLLGMKFDKTKC